MAGNATNMMTCQSCGGKGRTADAAQRMGTCAECGGRGMVPTGVARPAPPVQKQGNRPTAGMKEH